MKRSISDPDIHPPQKSSGKFKVPFSTKNLLRRRKKKSNSKNKTSDIKKNQKKAIPIINDVISTQEPLCTTSSSNQSDDNTKTSSNNKNISFIKQKLENTASQPMTQLPRKTLKNSSSSSYLFRPVGGISGSEKKNTLTVPLNPTKLPKKNGNANPLLKRLANRAIAEQLSSKSSSQLKPQVSKGLFGFNRNLSTFSIAAKEESEKIATKLRQQNESKGVTVAVVPEDDGSTSYNIGQSMSTAVLPKVSDLQGAEIEENCDLREDCSQDQLARQDSTINFLESPENSDSDIEEDSIIQDIPGREMVTPGKSTLNEYSDLVERMPLTAPLNQIVKSNSTSSLFVLGLPTAPDFTEVLISAAINLLAHIRVGINYVNQNGWENVNTHPSLYIFDNPVPSPKDPLNSLVEPSLVLLYRFMEHIFVRLKLSIDCGVFFLIMIDRLQNETNLLILPRNWKRIVLSTLIISSKLFDDLTLFNADILHAFPSLSLEDVNHVERKTLIMLKYQGIVSASDYAYYYFHLRSLATLCTPLGTASRLTKRRHFVIKHKIHAHEHDCGHGADIAISIVKHGINSQDQSIETTLSRQGWSQKRNSQFDQKRNRKAITLTSDNRHVPLNIQVPTIGDLDLNNLPNSKQAEIANETSMNRSISAWGFEERDKPVILN